MMRGAGGSRGARGNMMRGRGMHRPAATGISHNSDNLYEDVYEPISSASFTNSFAENGGLAGSLGVGSGGGNSYFEEFPEPNSDNRLGGLEFARNAQRSVPAKPMRFNHNHMSSLQSIHQKAF